MLDDIIIQFNTMNLDLKVDFDSSTESDKSTEGSFDQENKEPNSINLTKIFHTSIEGNL